MQGEKSTNYVRHLLNASRIDCSDPVREPDLQEPPVYSFIATPQEASPLTAPELQAILDDDDNVEVAFDV